MTETMTLTDRYVAAAVRTVPEPSRADLAAELHASIADQIDARVDAGELREAAERDVLTALGDPDKLAAGYTDRPLWLIGPRYFLEWWRLLKLLLWIVLPCAAFGVALGKTLSGAEPGDVIGTTVVVLFSVAVHLGFWTTLVFALVERLGARSRGDGPHDDGLAPWSLDQLPEPRSSGAGRGELIASLVFLAAGVGAVLWDRFVGFAPSHPGLSLLDEGLWPWWIAALFVVMAGEAALMVVVYAVGRWTPALAAVNGILNLAVAVPALWLLVQGRLLDPVFWTTLIPADSAATVANVVTIVVGFVIAGIAVWDTVDAALKARVGARG